jgi:two-component system, cell cycle sensor histidine kinase and response regulator CckA
MTQSPSAAHQPAAGESLAESKEQRQAGRPSYAAAPAQKKLEIFRALIDQSSDAIFVVDPQQARIMDVNERACRTLGYTRGELLNLTMPEIEAAYDGFTWHEQVEKVRQGEVELLETGQRRKNGETFPVEISLKLVTVEDRSYVVAAARDITEKKQLEAKFLRAQRLESIGRLAGGIAHDLNNVLGPVLLSVQLLRAKMPDRETQDILDLLEGSARRGTAMIKQILTFARGIKGQRIAVHMRELINETVKIGRETFPRSIQIKAAVPSELWPIIGDGTQLHQVLMNLCLNACDAMPEGGVLELRAENRQVDAKEARRHPEAQAGPYVLLSIRDTGIGIPPEILDKIFEPFFTTKGFGQGTGLGLATALGIVQGHGGFVAVDSELNKGSCFNIFLPAHKDLSAPAAEAAASPSKNGAHRLVLVVEDDRAMRLLTQAVLTAHDYDVLTANDGAEAVALYKDRQQEIQAVIMDMAMPYMDGAAAIRAIRKMNPDARILAVSGLMDQEKAGSIPDLEDITLLVKPYSPNKLLSELVAVIER